MKNKGIALPNTLASGRWGKLAAVPRARCRE
jgi:hypothetical protein